MVFPCNEFNTEDECFSYLQITVAEILKTLADWKKLSLAKEWCHHWGSCTAHQINKVHEKNENLKSILKNDVPVNYNPSSISFLWIKP